MHAENRTEIPELIAQLRRVMDEPPATWTA